MDAAAGSAQAAFGDAGPRRPFGRTPRGYILHAAADGDAATRPGRGGKPAAGRGDGLIGIPLELILIDN